MRMGVRSSVFLKNWRTSRKNEKMERQQGPFKKSWHAVDQVKSSCLFHDLVAKGLEPSRRLSETTGPQSTSAFRIAFRARQVTERDTPGKRSATNSRDAHRWVGGGGPFTRSLLARDRRAHVTAPSGRKNGGRLGARDDAVAAVVSDTTSHHTSRTGSVAGVREPRAIQGIIHDRRSSCALSCRAHGIKAS